MEIKRQTTFKYIQNFFDVLIRLFLRHINIDLLILITYGSSFTINRRIMREDIHNYYPWQQTNLRKTNSIINIINLISEVAEAKDLSEKKRKAPQSPGTALRTGISWPPPASSGLPWPYSHTDTRKCYHSTHIPIHNLSPPPPKININQTRLRTLLSMAAYC